jgi:hypothetical protein
VACDIPDRAAYPSELLRKSIGLKNDTTFSIAQIYAIVLTKVTHPPQPVRCVVTMNKVTHPAQPVRCAVTLTKVTHPPQPVRCVVTMNKVTYPAQPVRCVVILTR